jgi:hypothetical protein
MVFPFKKWLLFSFISILSNIILIKVTRLDDLVFNSLAENLTSEQIENFFNFQEKWQWISYVFILFI